uniref:Uncharacterized protein n=1 Tax=viral metagenome TaxID=1070528 RepID=A0A6M3MBB3_9ZZZZ
MTGEKWGQPNHGADLLSDLGTKISEWVASADDWAKWKVNDHPGLYVVKMPAKKETPAHGALEINPADQFGNPTKRRGIYIRSLAEMQDVANLFGGKIPKAITTLCDAVFDENAAPQTPDPDALVIA